MQTTFIVRLFDADRHVLAWTRIPCMTKGDGCLWPEQHFVAEADVTGVATDICYHWVDVNVHTTVPLPERIPVEVGKVVTVPLFDPLLRLNSDARPLPAVTVRQSIEVCPASANR
jgi:hypothetical protein